MGYTSRYGAILGPFVGLVIGALATDANPGVSQAGGAEPPVRYIGPGLVDPGRPDGALRPVVGAHNYQVLRACREHPELSGGKGWTYNHAPMLAYWQGRFWLEFLSNPRDEHGFPTQALLTSSADGRRWSKPELAFPEWESGGSGDFARSLIHHRMAFYTAPNGRLLVSSHYGSPDRTPGGPGHVVREIHADASLGPINFIRFGSGWSESNAFYPFYARSPDPGFVAACNALLADRLVTDQWFELQEGFPDGAYARVDGQYDPRVSRRSLAFFRRKDGAVVGLWKRAWTALSLDEGRTWTNLVQAPGVARTFAKVWGQRTADGRYVLAFDPQDHPPGNRWPLVVATGDDGSIFANMLSIHGEVPQRRYPGAAKDIGPQYVRGIVEGNGSPPGSDLWLCYSVNKEDIWVSLVPVPIRSSADEPVWENFESLAVGIPPAGWNIYSPEWAPVTVAHFPDIHNRCLELTDGDPFDYARAVRVFPESRRVNIDFRALSRRGGAGRLEIDVMDARGRRPVRLWWAEDGRIQTVNGQRVRDLGPLRGEQWISVHLEIDAGARTYRLALDGRPAIVAGAFSEAADSVERVSFRTGEPRNINWDQAGPQKPVDGPPDELKYFTGAVEPAIDHPITAAVFCVDDVRITPQ